MWESKAERIREIQQWPYFQQPKPDTKTGPLDMCPEHERGNVLMMMMAGGDEAEFNRIKYERPFDESWLLHARRLCAFYREPYDKK